MKKLILIASMMTAFSALSGCVPLAIGAGGAIAADAISEDRGRDLF